MTQRRWICLLLALVLCFGLAAQAAAYSNVAPWAQEYVDDMAELGLIPTCLLNADLSQNITRAEMCKLAVQAYGKFGLVTKPASNQYFGDTTDDEICFAYELGIVAGSNDGNFYPNNALTRQDLCVIINAFLTVALDWDGTYDAFSLEESYADADSIAGYAQHAVEAMSAIGVIAGDGTNVNPRGTTTRQEAIVMFRAAYYFFLEWSQNNSGETEERPSYSGISPWAVTYVMKMAELGLIPESFLSVSMSDTINRAEMCEIAMLAYNKIAGVDYTPTRTDYFPDCSAAEVAAAYELGIVAGDGKGNFNPNDLLTREQFFRIVNSFMIASGYPRKDSRSVSLAIFEDANQISSWAQSASRVLIYVGAVVGDGVRLNPKREVTYQEALTMFLKAYLFCEAWVEQHPEGGEIEDEEISVAEELVAYALTFVGYDYVYGGKSPSTGFDCSGFTYYLFGYFGYPINRTADYQIYNGIAVELVDLMPGDIICFTPSASSSNITHVGLYIGDGKFIHAANSSRGVVIDALSGYWLDRVYGARRIIY